jgi:mycoredoxin
MLKEDGNIEDELEAAERARLEGNEGRARVCARRAAGIAARDFLIRQGVRLRDASAYSALQALAEFPGLMPELRTYVSHLVIRVTENFTLPMDADLITDARKLIGGLKMNDTLEITIYGTSWCGGVRRARLLFDQQHIPYRWVDIDQNEQAALYVESLANGYRSVPTIVWPDGSFLVEPTTEALAIKLGIIT